jgi:hypothetical protein
MRLMRNVTPDGQCKYAVIRMDKAPSPGSNEGILLENALTALTALGLLENPRPGEQEEFFLVKLKDINALPALRAYAESAWLSDSELAEDVYALANRAGANSPWCRKPD